MKPRFVIGRRKLLLSAAALAAAPVAKAAETPKPTPAASRSDSWLGGV